MEPIRPVRFGGWRWTAESADGPSSSIPAYFRLAELIVVYILGLSGGVKLFFKIKRTNATVMDLLFSRRSAAGHML